MTDKHLLLLSVHILLAMTLGCGSSSTSTTHSQPEFLYAIAFSQPGSPQLIISRLDAFTGVLGPTTTMPLQTQLVTGIAVDPASRFLYLSNPTATPSEIDIFSIDPNTGLLTANGNLPLASICAFCPPASAPGALAMDAQGKFLFYGSSSGGAVSQGIGALAVNSTTGALTAVPGSPFPADQAPLLVLVHPSGQFLYTGNTSTSFIFPSPLQSVSGFAIDSGGALAPVHGSPFIPPTSVDVGGLALHPAGTFLYAGTGAAANGILAWSIDSTGAISPLPASPFAGVATTFSVVIDPSGKFLYVSNGPSGGISGLMIDASSGGLTPISGSPFDPAVLFGAQVIDPTGRLLVAVDAKNSAIAVFMIDASTGALTLRGNPIPVNAHPISLIAAKAR